jgi:hypothetical protein
MNTPKKSPFELWQDTINLAIKDKKWHEYDSDIQLAVNEFNRHLANTKGYVLLDWRLIKAMVWTESGATSDAWTTRPIQIGNPGDPGLDSLISGKEGGELILPDDLKRNLNAADVRKLPGLNIRAGIAYLLMRCANYGFESQVDKSDNKVYDYVVQPGDNLDKIARMKGSTLDVLKKLNPKAATGVLQIKQVVKYQKASIQKVITGWQRIDTKLIARRYNTAQGDPKYAEKLDYCLTVIDKTQGAACPK